MNDLVSEMIEQAREFLQVAKAYLSK